MEAQLSNFQYKTDRVASYPDATIKDRGTPVFHPVQIAESLNPDATLLTRLERSGHDRHTVSSPTRDVITVGNTTESVFYEPTDLPCGDDGHPTVDGRPFAFGSVSDVLADEGSTSRFIAKLVGYDPAKQRQLLGELIQARDLLEERL